MSNRQAALRDWGEDPVTQMVLRELVEIFPPVGWKTAETLEALRRAQGRQEVVDYLLALCRQGK